MGGENKKRTKTKKTHSRTPDVSPVLVRWVREGGWGGVREGQMFHSLRLKESLCIFKTDVCRLEVVFHCTGRNVIMLIMTGTRLYRFRLYIVFPLHLNIQWKTEEPPLFTFCSSSPILSEQIKDPPTHRTPLSPGQDGMVSAGQRWRDGDAVLFVFVRLFYSVIFLYWCQQGLKKQNKKKNLRKERDVLLPKINGQTFPWSFCDFLSFLIASESLLIFLCMKKTKSSTVAAAHINTASIISITLTMLKLITYINTNLTNKE